MTTRMSGLSTVFTPHYYNPPPSSQQVHLNVCVDLSNVNNFHYFFNDPIKNNIVAEGNFSKLYFSNDLMCLNGLHLILPLTYTKLEKYYNKYKCYLDTTYSGLNGEVFKELRNLETTILKCYSSQKTPAYKLCEQLKNDYIKMFLGQTSDVEETHNDTDCFTRATNTNNTFIASCPIKEDFILKISGIWETKTHYGLTYKFIKPMSTTNMNLL